MVTLSHNSIKEDSDCLSQSSEGLHEIISEMCVGLRDPRAQEGLHFSYPRQENKQHAT